MRQFDQQAYYGFGSGFTRTGKRLLLIYGIIYVMELLLEHWLVPGVVPALFLYPVKDPAFGLWQLFTHPFIHNPFSPLAFLLNALAFYFFSAPVEAALGRRGFLLLFYAAAIGGAICGLLTALVFGFGGPFYGMLPSVLALVVIFGLLSPDATILLMFILPIRAKYLSYGTVAITLLTLLAKANAAGAYHMGGILFGWLMFKGYGGFFDPDQLHLKYLQWQYKRRRSRFKVINGRKDGDGNGPTYH